ncbi:hypothetical protein TrVE_jg6500 [Triparma verrucosa]|uniref:Uncharacterized protein n=1 Tax=Triparma verrucosa TaxID=1606542 RepID=A0A9W7EL84_9STRA|nr:hypothetical protein TrVE_jg6500 [Triparma verrucosa]
MPLPKSMSPFVLLFLLLSLASAQDPTNAPTVSPAPTAFPTAAPTNETVTECDISAYNEWAAEEFQGISKDLVIPATNERWWDIQNYQTGVAFTLTNAHAVEVLGTKCRQYMQAIKIGLSGRHGPVSDQAIFDVMCTEYCVVNDQFREEAMSRSKCSCLDLSTKEWEVGYSVAGDYCRENSGRMMCDELERCGMWECALDDFSCPRMEYNTLDVLLRGNPGDCGEGVGVFGGLLLGTVMCLGMSLWLSL